MRDPDNPYVPSAFDAFPQSEMDAWTADILRKTQGILKGVDPWAAVPRPPSPLRAQTPPLPITPYSDSQGEDGEEGAMGFLGDGGWQLPGWVG